MRNILCKGRKLEFFVVVNCHTCYVFCDKYISLITKGKNQVHSYGPNSIIVLPTQGIDKCVLSKLCMGQKCLVVRRTTISMLANMKNITFYYISSDIRPQIFRNIWSGVTWFSLERGLWFIDIGMWHYILHGMIYRCASCSLSEQTQNIRILKVKHVNYLFCNYYIVCIVFRW